MLFREASLIRDRLARMPGEGKALVLLTAAMSYVYYNQTSLYVGKMKVRFLWYSCKGASDG